MSSQTDILTAIPTDPLTGAVAVPVYQTTTFAQEAPGINQGFAYSRSNNPTRQILEKLIATLENGAKGFAFSSGLAAIDSIFKTLSSGDEVIAVANIYGGTYRLLEDVYAKFGVKTHYVDSTLITNIEHKLTARTKLIWIESPTNPTLKITDITAVAKIAQAHKVLLCVDNTFATPIAQKPLELGADIVVHSATKYIAGHSDVTAGLVITKTEALGEQIKFHQNSTGAILSPWESFLTIRGIETLPLRFRSYAASALKIATFLKQQKVIRHIYYPGLIDHEGHELAKKQQKNYGAVISFDFHNDTKETALTFLKNLQYFKLTEGLGGTHSYCNYPTEMSHTSVPKAVKLKTGITNSLVRLSIGLEETEDLINDIKQALAKVQHHE